jgi:nitroreductase
MHNNGTRMTISPDHLLTALRWRYATKRFDPLKKIPPATWEAIEDALVLTPSSFGLQPWKFLVIDHPGVRANLLAESWGQTQVTEASHYLVLTARTDLAAADIDSWMARMTAVQGSTLQTLAPLKGMIEGFAQSMSHEARHAWNIRQVYIALGQLMTAAAVLGIDACPMEGISPAGYDQILGLQGTGYATVVACALGYRATDDRHATLPKARFDHSKIIQHIT